MAAPLAGALVAALTPEVVKLIQKAAASLAEAVLEKMARDPNVTRVNRNAEIARLLREREQEMARDVEEIVARRVGAALPPPLEGCDV